MCLRRLCCDPHRLTYVAAIFTAVEAFFFGALNLTLILLNKCIIQPPDSPLGGGLDKFYTWYFFSNESCYDRHGDDYEMPVWVYDSPYPIANRTHETSVEANLNYQYAYLGLHAAWILTAFILIYGNARKLWGFYIPWLLVSLTMLVMDVTIASFFIQDMITVTDNSYNLSGMIWAFTMYLRLIFFWFSNLGHTATGINAFCKTHHKRSKQERQEKKMKKKHQKELEEAKAAAAAEARAAALEEAKLQASRGAQMYPPLQNAQPPQDMMRAQAGYQNMAYDNPYPPLNQPYPGPSYQPPKVPKEVRPFSYLNPSFRPNDPHDVTGMKANPSNFAGPVNSSKRPSYFSAVPPVDYDDGDSGQPPRVLPRINMSPGQQRAGYQAPPRSDLNNQGYY